MKFKFLDITTADIAFESYGKSLDQLFSNAALAMFEVMVNTKQIKPKIEKKVELKTKDILSLLFEWLNGLLLYYGSENLAFSKFEVKINEKKFELKARCFGEEIYPEKHETRTEVKSCTYHRMEVKKTDNQWTAQVILDI